MDVLNELARQEMFYIALGYLVIGIFVVGAVFLRERKEDQKLNDYMVELKPNFAERRRCQEPYQLYSLKDRRETKGRDLDETMDKPGDDPASRQYKFRVMGYSIAQGNTA